MDMIYCFHTIQILQLPSEFATDIEENNKRSALDVTLRRQEHAEIK